MARGSCSTDRMPDVGNAGEFPGLVGTVQREICSCS